jgi:hypothetical protein
MSGGATPHAATPRSMVHAVVLTIALILTGTDLTAPKPSHAQTLSDSTSLALGPRATSAGLYAPRFGGYIQSREILQKDIGLTSLLNRARFSIDGVLPNQFAYRFLIETEASAGAKVPAIVSLREASVRWNPAPFSMTAGEFKTPFTREYLIPIPALELADLATVVDSLAPKYDVGVMGELAVGAMGTLSLGVFNGEGANAVANRDSLVMLVGRVTARPISQLGIGASATRDGPDSLRWGLDASVQQSGAVVRAEYITRHVRGRATDKDDFGWYVFESLRLVPRFQLVARQEDFQRPLRGLSKRMRGMAYGTNIDLAPSRVRLLLEYSQRTSGQLQTNSDTYIAQLQVQF